jgi:hypothetical protein
MPVERGPQINLRSALVIGLTGAVVAGLLFVFVSWLASTGGVDVQLGDDVFRAGRTQERADSIAEDGPILFGDVAGGTRDIYLQHLGDEPDEGWVAFDARRPGAPRECFLQWSPDDREFVDPCDGSVFPADGEGLPRYPVLLVDDGRRLEVDLRGTSATTTTTPSP